MKAKLRKLNDGYYTLYDLDGDIVASNNPNTPCVEKLSKENCDKIFGIVDVEKLGDEHALEMYTKNEDDIVFYENRQRNFIEGFQKAIELNKDKLFTVDDLYRVFLINSAGNNTTLRNFFEKTVLPMFEQPTEIEVEIETEPYVKYVSRTGNTVFPPLGIQNKLDSHGDLILKKL
jgi:hypothetical protein